MCRSVEDAQALLDRVKAQYTTPADENADFLQEVHVDTVVAETRLVSDFGELYDYLSPRLDVTATRSVTYTEEIPYETITRENDQHEPDLPRHPAGGLRGRKRSSLPRSRP